MNREEAATVVQSHDRIDVGMIKNVAPQRGRTGIDHHPRRQYQADAAAWPRELQRALQEQLVAVDVRAAFHAVDPGFSREVGDLARFNPTTGTDVGVATVAADHVPRRVADHGVETRVRLRLALVIHGGDSSYRDYEKLWGLTDYTQAFKVPLMKRLLSASADLPTDSIDRARPAAAARRSG